LFLISGGNALLAQQSLPPDLTRLFPGDASNITGSFVPQPSPFLFRADLTGKIPGKHTCSNEPELGTLKIELVAFDGSKEGNLMANMQADGWSQSHEKAYQSAKKYDSGDPRRTVTFSRDEPIEGGLAFYHEATVGCVEDVHPSYTETIFQSDARQGNIFITIEGNFRGTALEAKAILLETLGKISKTDFQKLSKH
jgi:hypothetical protein